MGRLLTRKNIAPVVRNLFQIRSQSFFDPNIVSLEVLPAYIRFYTNMDFSVLVIQFCFFIIWAVESVKSKIEVFENAWNALVLEHSSFDFAKSRSEYVPPKKFWSSSSSKIWSSDCASYSFRLCGFSGHFDLIWSSQTTIVKQSNPTDGSHMSDFLVDLEQHQKALLLTGCLPLLFDSATIMMITRFVTSAVGKIYRLRTEKLRKVVV